MKPTFPEVHADCESVNGFAVLEQPLAPAIRRDRSRAGPVFATMANPEQQGIAQEPSYNLSVSGPCRPADGKGAILLHARFAVSQHN